MTKLRHYDNPGDARFVTFCCHNKLPLLENERDRKILIEELDMARAKYNFKILGYVVMPNHVHLVLLPSPDMKLGLVIGQIKSMSARRILDRWRNEGICLQESIHVKRNGHDKIAFWQRRCYDRNCRNDSEVWKSIEYCHNNPVKRGLVEDSGSWKWSSYDSYVGRRGDSLRVDSPDSSNPPQGVGYTCI